MKIIAIVTASIVVAIFGMNLVADAPRTPTKYSVAQERLNTLNSITAELGATR
jgi:hypothetical protein